MKSRALLLGILLALVAVGSIIADNQAPAPVTAANGATAVPSVDPSPDPFLGASEISSTKETHIVCVAEPDECTGSNNGARCGFQRGCRCISGVCTKNH